MDNDKGMHRPNTLDMKCPKCERLLALIHWEKDAALHIGGVVEIKCPDCHEDAKLGNFGIPCVLGTDKHATA